MANAIQSMSMLALQFALKWRVLFVCVCVCASVCRAVCAHNSGLVVVYLCTTQTIADANKLLHLLSIERGVCLRLVLFSLVRCIQVT